MKLIGEISTRTGRKLDGDLTYIILGQEVEGTKDLIVVKFEALGGLQVSSVIGVWGHFEHLLRLPSGPVLSMRILRLDSRTSATATVMTVGV